MIRPAIEGWVVVDLSKYVDKYGGLTAGAPHQAWRLAAGCPSGVSIRIHVGTLRHSNPELIYNLKDAGVMEAARIEITGSDPAGIAAVMDGLRAIREVA